MTTQKEKWTQEEVFVRFAQKHGKKDYDYSDSVFVDLDTIMEIRHIQMGMFEMTPREHFYFGHPNRTQNDEGYEKLLAKCNKKHTNLYTYPPQSYRETRDRIIIQCALHGEFSKVVSIHANGQGCPTCAKLTKRKPRTQIIEEGNKRYNSKYLYCLLPPHPVKQEMVMLICPSHGMFEQRLEDHLLGHVGCDGCRKERNKPNVEHVVGQYTRTVSVNNTDLNVFTVNGKEFLLRREVAAALGHKQISHVFDKVDDTEKARISINLTKYNPFTSLVTPLGMAQAVYTTRKIDFLYKEEFIKKLSVLFPEITSDKVTEYLHRLKGVKLAFLLKDCSVEVYEFDNKPHILLSTVKEWLGHGLRTVKGYVSNNLKHAISDNNKRVEYGNVVSGSYLTTYITIEGLLEALAHTVQIPLKEKHNYYKELKGKYTLECIPPLEDYLLPGDKRTGSIQLFGKPVYYTESDIGRVFNSREVSKALGLGTNLNYSDKIEGEHIYLKATNQATIGNQIFVTPLIVAQKIQHSRQFPVTEKHEALKTLSEEFHSPFDIVCRTYKETDFMWDIQRRISKFNILYKTTYKLQRQVGVKQFKLDGVLELKGATIIVEFDEKYHKSQAEKDRLRMEEIINTLHIENPEINYEVIRVPEEEVELYQETIISKLYEEHLTNPKKPNYNKTK